MAKRNEMVCVCGHPDGRHAEEHDDVTGETWRPCKACPPGECPEMEVDYAGTRAAEAEYRQLEYDIRRGK